MNQTRTSKQPKIHMCCIVISRSQVPPRVDKLVSGMLDCGSCFNWRGIRKLVLCDQKVRNIRRTVAWSSAGRRAVSSTVYTIFKTYPQLIVCSKQSTDTIRPIICRALARHNHAKNVRNRRHHIFYRVVHP